MKLTPTSTASIFLTLIASLNLPMAVELDQRDDYGEDQWIGTGLLDGRVVVVIYTEPDSQTVRIISLRKALSSERRNYEQYLKNGLG
jgi:uncharacterized protein